MLKLVWWEHDSKLGKLPPYQLHAATTVDYDEKAADFNQVKINVDDPHHEGLKVEEIDGY